MLALVDVGSPVESCVGVKQHARSAIPETVAVERGHEDGEGMWGLSRNVAGVVEGLSAMCDEL